MHQAITLGSLLLGVAVLVGLAIAAIGALEFFAGGMSDAPEAGNQAAKRGCFFVVLGIVIAAASIYGCAAV